MPDLSSVLVPVARDPATSVTARPRHERPRPPRHLTPPLFREDEARPPQPGEIVGPGAYPSGTGFGLSDRGCVGVGSGFIIGLNSRTKSLLVSSDSLTAWPPSSRTRNFGQSGPISHSNWSAGCPPSVQLWPAARSFVNYCPRYGLQVLAALSQYSQAIWNGPVRLRPWFL